MPDLGKIFRKAASLVVEFPPEQEAASPRTEASGESEVMREARKAVAAVGSQQNTAPVSPPAPATTVADLVRRMPGPNLEDIRVQPEAAKAVTIGPDGVIDFQAVYDMAGLPKSAFSAEQVLQLMQELPSELPLETKRRTVAVSVKAMGGNLGATPETVLTDASRKLAAITAFDEQTEKLCDDYEKTAQTAIQQLQAKIAEYERNIQSARQRKEAIHRQCAAKTDALDDILEFFTADVAPSRFAAPSVTAGDNARATPLK